MAVLTKDGHDKVTTVTEPWESQIPYLEQGFGEAQNLYEQGGPAYFPGSTVAPFSDAQLQSQQMITDTATQGSPVMDAANAYALNVLQGGQMPNPYEDPVFNNIQSHVMPAINAQSMMAGRTPTAGEGSNLYADTMTRGLTEAYAPWASQNWQFGQNQMSDMAKYAPDLRKMDYFDAGALGLVGQEQQGLAQKELQDAQTRWDYYQQLPYNKLSDYMGMVGGTNWGGTSTTKSPTTKPSGLGEALGAGLSIAGAAGKLLGGGGLFGGGGIFG